MTTDKGLMVWLPLNGTLENKGLVKSTITSSGVRWSNSGKIGKCFDNNDRGNRWILLQNAFPAHDTDHTVCFWVKSLPNIAAYNDWGYIYTTSNVNATDAAKCNIDVNTTNGYKISDSCPTFIVTVNDRTQWNHITIVTTKTKVVVYINGQYSNEQTRNATIVSSATRHIAISRNSTESDTSWNMRGSINDFRVYSYALSPQEIKELSRGKIGHWLGDGNGTFLPNVLGTPTVGYQGYTKLSNNDWDISQRGSSGFVRFQNLGMNGVAGPWVISFIAWASTEYTTNIDLCDVGNKQIKIKTTPSKFFITATASNYYQINNYNGFLDIGMPTNISKLYIRDLKMEKGTIPSAYSASNQAFLSDISGFGRHGQIVGNVTLDSSTPRYDKSIKFSTNTCERYIAAPAMNFLTNTLTFSCWVSQFNRTCVNNKVDHTLQFIMSQGRDNTAGFSLICRNGVPGVMFGNGTTFKSIFNSSVMPLNTWHHIAATYDGTNVKFYYDGNYIAQSTISNIEYLLLKDPTTGVLGYPNPALVLGKMSFGYTSTGTYFPFAGNISDARVYATALSADDVKELYSLGH